MVHSIKFRVRHAVLPSIVLSAALLVACFCAVSMPVLTAAILALLIVTLVLAATRDAGGVLVAAITTSVLLAALEFGLLVLGYDPSAAGPMQILRVPGQMYFRANAQLLQFPTRMPDLVSMSLSPAESLVEPHPVDFITDALGYRNRKDYSGEHYVVIGDSFAAGLGTTQSEILSEQLSRKLGQPIYNAAFPTHPAGYIAIRERLVQHVGDSFESIFIIFEGNDFYCGMEEVEGITPNTSGWWHWRFSPFASLRIFQISFGLFTRALYRIFPDNRDVPFVAEYAGKQIGFLPWYVRVTKRPRPCNNTGWDAMFDLYRQVAAKTALLVFVPTKYRVYWPLLSPETPQLPNVQWEYLRDKGKSLGIRTLNLTPALQDASRALAANGEFTWWRGDTHWNGNGIAVAAHEIAKALQGR